MKKITSLIVIALFFVACQNKDANTAGNDSAGSTKYPYTLKKIQGWEMNNNTKNVMAALSLIKGFENLDTAAMGKVLADSVWLDLDGYRFKGTRAEFLTEIQSEFGKISSFKILMEDTLSVINKDKTEEWVSLWYTQIANTKDGKIDTVRLFNDVQIKAGKVSGLSEYSQHQMKK